eukprot:6210629-Pleurochrysis_carterae.AAC.1
MHLSFAHLTELITTHGMLSRHDDKVLERKNRTAKRIKSNLLFWGGSSKPDETHIVDLRAAKKLDPEAPARGPVRTIRTSGARA